MIEYWFAQTTDKLKVGSNNNYEEGRIRKIVWLINFKKIQEVIKIICNQANSLRFVRFLNYYYFIIIIFTYRNT